MKVGQLCFMGLRFVFFCSVWTQKDSDTDHFNHRLMQENFENERSNEIGTYPHLRGWNERIFH